MATVANRASIAQRFDGLPQHGLKVTEIVDAQFIHYVTYELLEVDHRTDVHGVPVSIQLLDHHDIRDVVVVFTVPPRVLIGVELPRPVAADHLSGPEFLTDLDERVVHDPLGRRGDYVLA